MSLCVQIALYVYYFVYTLYPSLYIFSPCTCPLIYLFFMRILLYLQVVLYIYRSIYIFAYMYILYVYILHVQVAIFICLFWSIIFLYAYLLIYLHSVNISLLSYVYSCLYRRLSQITATSQKDRKENQQERILKRNLANKITTSLTLSMERMSTNRNISSEMFSVLPCLAFAGNLIILSFYIYFSIIFMSSKEVTTNAYLKRTICSIFTQI